MAHWTSANSKAFIHRITFDFIAQIEKKIDVLNWKQSDLAKKLGVTEGSVSQVLNSERNNLTLRSMVSYANAVGLKIAIVAYDDDDPQNDYGPVGSEIFEIAWDKLGKPRDIWSLKENVQAISTNRASLERSYVGHVFIANMLSHTAWNCSSGSISTSSGQSGSFSMTSIEQGSTLTHA
jgi:transcriptional regulator with XRE-family HTH domain